MSTMPATTVTTGKARLSFVNFEKPRAMQEGGKEKFSVLVMMPKSDKATYDRMQAAIQAAINLGKNKHWGGKQPAVLKNTFKDADKDNDNSGEIFAEKYPEMKDHYIINVATDRRPSLVMKDLSPCTDVNTFYSGCYANVCMNFYPYKHATGGNGISAGLQSVRFLDDGDPLGSTVSAETAFAGLE